MMRIVFVSNNYNHHERFFCEELNKTPEVNFHFVQTKPMSEERLKLGWGIDVSKFHFVVDASSNQNTARALMLCNEADIVIFGSAPYIYIAERVRKNKITFFYAERLFRNGIWHMIYPPTFFTVLRRFIIPGRKSNFYLLAASAYTAWDTSRIFTFNNRRFKWGHFIEVQYPKNRMRETDNTKLSLLWAGRFLQLKHPDYPIRIAKTLKSKGISFILNIIGSGEKGNDMRKLISDNHLEDVIITHGTMKPTEVRKFMENADIYMFTSDFNEGWGAVLGESMISGCAVVTSHGIGATPFLVQHGHNGLIYETGNYDSFERNVIKLVESKKLREKLSRNAIDTMLNNWSPQIGAERFYNLCKSLLSGADIPYYPNGPISKAEILENNWFKDDTI